MPGSDESKDGELLSVPIGRWAVAMSPTRIQTILGSCVGIVLIDPRVKVGGLAHVVLPDSRGATDQPGKFADTAVPALLADLRKRAPAARPVAKLTGGASMFPPGNTTNPTLAIGQANVEAVEKALAKLHVAVIARDLGGDAGRRVVLDLRTGTVVIRVPGREEYEI